MFQLTQNLPKNCYVAVSGGPDSIAALHWLSNTPGRVVGVIHVNHNSGAAASMAEAFVNSYISNRFGHKLHTFKVVDKPHKKQSLEEFWREQRLAFFSQFTDYPIATGHNLDDCVEEYIINKLVRFSPKNTICYNGPSGIIRPFRTWTKQSMLDYCIKNNLRYITDPSNSNNKFLRNSIRNIYLPKLLQLNPGIYTQVKKLIIDNDY